MLLAIILLRMFLWALLVAGEIGEAEDTRGPLLPYKRPAVSALHYSDSSVWIFFISYLDSTWRNAFDDFEFVLLLVTG